jgi:hypothetical protein
LMIVDLRRSFHIARLKQSKYHLPQPNDQMVAILPVHSIVVGSKRG